MITFHHCFKSILSWKQILKFPSPLHHQCHHPGLGTIPSPKLIVGPQPSPAAPSQPPQSHRTGLSGSRYTAPLVFLPSLVGLCVTPHWSWGRYMEPPALDSALTHSQKRHLLHIRSCQSQPITPPHMSCTSHLAIAISAQPLRAGASRPCHTAHPACPSLPGPSALFSSWLLGTPPADHWAPLQPGVLPGEEVPSGSPSSSLQEQRGPVLTQHTGPRALF